ncbi:MAG: oxyR [Rhodospirillales bacterium]|nr:oxyR [Rhodospirillales bacterium]
MSYLPSLRQLRYLVALAENGHFGRAAEQCGVTQSTFSGAIQELEAGLGVSLVERSKRHVLVTPLGQDIAERARVILRASEDLVEATRAARAPLTGPLRLGVIPTIGPYLLPRLLPRLRREFPKLRLYVREEPTAALIDGLSAGRLDVLLAATPYAFGNRIETLRLAEDEILVACPADHALASRKRVDGERLRHEALLLLEDGHCLRSQALSACGLADADRNEEFQGTSVRTLLQMVAEGLGTTLIPRLAVDSELRGDAKRRVAIRPLGPGRHARTLVLAWRAASGRRSEFERLGATIAAQLAAAES